MGFFKISMFRSSFLSVMTLSILMLWHPSVMGQRLEAHRNTVDGSYNFWVYSPNIETDSIHADREKLPLLIFLHGASLCGKDLERVRRYGPLHALSMGREIESFIAAPQNPGGAWKPEKINKMLEWVVANYPIDTNRIYVFGMSLGGYGTIDFVGTYPDKVAAAIAMCGGSQLKNFCGLNEVPLWILHGTADRQVPLSQSKRIVSAMERCGSTKRLQFTTLQGVNHGGPARVFYLSTPYEWLFSHRLDTPLRPITPGFSVSPADLKGAYRDLRHGGKKLQVIDNSKQIDIDNKVAASESTGEYYKVKKGDTLGKIARRHGTTVSRLCQLNGIKSTSIIRAGQRLRVRG